MKANIGKGTEFFVFMGEFFKMLSNYWNPESDEKYWESLLSESEILLTKYSKCDFYQLAKALVLAYNVYLSDVKLKNKSDGRWTIDFRGN